MARLTFLGGPPGVGKSAIAERLLDLLPSCAWLDADDVWRFRPFVVDTTTTVVAEERSIMDR